MSESMRGSRLGSTSYEIDKGFNAPKQLTSYVCPADHQFTMPFAAEADEIPDTWACECGETGVRWGYQVPKQAPGKVARTHWDMLLERRSVKELDALLKERLELLRGTAKRTA